MKPNFAATRLTDYEDVSLNTASMARLVCAGSLVPQLMNCASYESESAGMLRSLRKTVPSDRIRLFLSGYCSASSEQQVISREAYPRMDNGKTCRKDASPGSNAANTRTIKRRTGHFGSSATCDGA